MMVGHSLGGALIRVFDRDFPGEVTGFVLVDSSHPEQDRRFPREIRETGRRDGHGAPVGSSSAHSVPNVRTRGADTSDGVFLAQSPGGGDG